MCGWNLLPREVILVFYLILALIYHSIEELSFQVFLKCGFADIRWIYQPIMYLMYLYTWSYTVLVPFGNEKRSEIHKILIIFSFS